MQFFSPTNRNVHIASRLFVFALCAIFHAEAQAQMTDILTYHNDVARTGQTLHEEVLNPGNVNTNQFGKQWTYQTDEKAFAEPLYAAGVQVPGKGEFNLLFVATENDSLYAFDADSTNVIWHVSLCASNEIPYQIDTCSITPQIGITSTPVIDRSLGPNGTIFVVAESQDPLTNCYDRLHAIDLATGEDRMPPVVITGTYPGTGDDSTNGTDYFIAPHYVNRAALLLLNSNIYIGWSSHCNSRPATSWLMAYDENSLTQTYIVNLEPNSYWGSIWNSGGGPSADPQGNIYVATGNGGQTDWTHGFNTNGFPTDGDFGCCLVKLSITNGALKVVDYFAPSDIAYESYVDWDLGSSCPVVLPDMVDSNGVVRQLVIVSGKDQKIFMADRTNLGKCNPANDNALYQEIDNIFPGPNDAPPDNATRSGGMWSIPAYFNGTMYFGPVRNPVDAFPFIEARLGAISSQSPTAFSYPGATPSISADGDSNAVVWTVEAIGDSGLAEATNCLMHAYAATNLADELYNTMQITNRDILGIGQKFTTPVVASGRVYIQSTNTVVVYGLLSTSSLTPIQQWRNTNFGNPSNVGRGANSACPAGDGIPNLAKYALGLTPSVPANLSQLVTSSLQNSNGQYFLTLSLQQWSNPPDVTFSTGVSSDLLNWSTLTNISVLANTPTNLIVQDNLPVNASSNSFVRLQFQLNSP